ncbi:MAG: BatD family protein, partial [Gammaproteobacteria bacterium]|nr:BatD family protein [Gammaproteobacteria bacterium]
VAGEERTYDSILNGKAYNVVERVYALFPQESGELNIAPARFEARVLQDGRITGRKVFESDPINVLVAPIPPPPVDFPNAAWLPAKSVELTEEWSRSPDNLPAGEPVTRHIRVTALGQLETQIPVVEPAVSDNIKVYPDKPELRNSAVPKGILATRKDQYAMIGIVPGVVELPELQLPWWNIDSGVWEIASLPGTTINILPSANALPPPPQEIETAEVDEGAAVETIVVQSTLWQQISMGLAALWALTVLAWWLSSRPARKPREPEEPPLHKQQSKFLKAARKAALDGDANGVKESLLGWSRLQWPVGAPRSMGELATRVSDPLARELRVLCNASYGPHNVPWDGERLAKALRSFSVLEDEREKIGADGLPPLMPRPASVDIRAR